MIDWKNILRRGLGQVAEGGDSVAEAGALAATAPAWAPIAFVLVLLILLFLIIAYAGATAGEHTGVTNPREPVSAVGSGGVLHYPENLDPEKAVSCLQSYIEANTPPASIFRRSEGGATFAQLLTAAARSSNVNPALLLAIGMQESGHGTKLSGNYNYFGWGPGKNFSSLAEAVGTQAGGMRTYFNRGQTTIELIGQGVGGSGPPNWKVGSMAYAPYEPGSQYPAVNQYWIPNVTSFFNAITRACPDLGGPPPPPVSDIKACKDVREIPAHIPVSPNSNRLAHTTMVSRLEALWEVNKSWRITEACPPVGKHKDPNHANGRAVDIALTIAATSQNIDRLLADVRRIGFNDILDEYRRCTGFCTGGHIHLEWHGP